MDEQTNIPSPNPDATAAPPVKGLCHGCGRKLTLTGRIFGDHALCNKCDRARHTKTCQKCGRKLNFIIRSRDPAFCLRCTRYKLQESSDDMHAAEYFIQTEEIYHDHKPLATWFLVAANIGVYILMILNEVDWWNPYMYDLVRWQGNYGPLIKEGEVWRLVTAAFLHAGFLHMIFNMWALAKIGRMLEAVVGRFQFIVLYVLTMLISSYSSLWAHPNTVSVGASGPIFGVLGAFLGYLVARKELIPKRIYKYLLTHSLVFVAYSVYSGFINEGIDNAAHAGGLISGFVIAYIITESIAGSYNLNFFKDVFLAGLFASLIWFVGPSQNMVVDGPSTTRDYLLLVEILDTRDKIIYNIQRVEGGAFNRTPEATYDLYEDNILEHYELEVVQTIEEWDDCTPEFEDIYSALHEYTSTEQKLLKATGRSLLGAENQAAIDRLTEELLAAELELYYALN